MRTYYEIEDEDAYLAGRDLLLRRCGRWATAHGLAMSPLLASAVMDSRHFSPDGRLGYWTPAQVRRALLEWLPEKVTAPETELMKGPDSLRTLLRYLDAHGLRDPRGAATEENEAAIDVAATEFAAALADQGRYGVAKLIATAATRRGVDVTDPAAMQMFMSDIQTGRAALDAGLLAHALERQAERPGGGEERTYAQLPVQLPPAAQLREAAEASRVVAQLRSFTEWVGPQGRTLTTAGHIRLADARELIVLLSTGEEHLRFRSAAELTGLNLIVACAKKARLVRKQGTRLVQVAKGRPVLADAEALWQRAFEALFDPELASAVCPPSWTDEPPRPVAQLYNLVVPDVLATIYSMEHPVPTARIAESVWVLVQAHFDVTWLSPLGLDAERRRTENDLGRIFDAFETIGAITSVYDVANGVFTSDLGEERGMPDDANLPFPGERAAALRERLTAPGRLVTFTPLGTRAMRQRLLAQGREAGLVGELADATAAELLGTIAEHYAPDTGAAEIAVWRAVRGGSVEPLLQAVRDCPFIVRRVAMVNVLSLALPEWDELAAHLSQDRELWPIILLMRMDEMDPARVSPEEALMIMTGSMLQMLELGGPEAVLTSLRSLPRNQRNDIIREVSDSGFPATETLEDWNSLVGRPARLTPSLPTGRRPGLRVIRNDQHRPGRKKGRHR
jgi:hypothetical protein